MKVNEKKQPSKRTAALLLFSSARLVLALGLPYLAVKGKDGDEGRADGGDAVYKDREPQRGEAEAGEQHQHHLHNGGAAYDSGGEHLRIARNGNGEGDLVHPAAEDGDIRADGHGQRFDAGHGDVDIRRGVRAAEGLAAAHKGELASRDAAVLDLGQRGAHLLTVALGVILGNAERRGGAGRGVAALVREHDDAVNAAGLELLDAVCGVGTELVGHDYASGVLVADGDIIGEVVRDVRIRDRDALHHHQISAAYADADAVYLDLHPAAGDLDEVLDEVDIDGVAIAGDDGARLRRVGIRQSVGRDLEQDVRLHALGLDSHDLGAALAEGSGLVEGHRAGVGYCVHGVAAVKEHTALGRAGHGAQPDKRQRNVQHAGAGKHQQHGRAAHGFLDGDVEYQRQQHQDENGDDRNYRREVGLYPDEGLGNHLSPLGAVLDGGEERRGGGIRGGRGDLAAELAVLIDAAGEYLVALLHQHGAGVVAERRAVEAGQCPRARCSRRARARRSG